MAERPVHDLTPDEALQELEQLADNPPTYAVDRPAWKERCDQLQTWVLMHQTPTTTPEPSMTPSPEEQLDTLLAKLSNATAECIAATDRKAFTDARNSVYQLRATIGRLVMTHAQLEAPTLPEIPTNPFAWGREDNPSRPVEMGRLQDLAQAAMSAEETVGPEQRETVIQHGQALLGLGDLIEHYPYQIDGEMSTRLGTLLTVLGNSLCSAVDQEAVA